MTANEKQYRGKIILVSIGVVLAGCLFVAMLWPKHSAPPPVLMVSRAERVRFIGDLPAMRWVTVCASNQNDSLSELHFASVGIEFRVTNQWLKVKGTLVGDLKPGQRCETGVLVPAQADILRVGLEYFQGKLVFRRKPWDDALIWILVHTKNRIPARLWQCVDGLRISNFKHVSLEVAIPSKD